MEVVNLDDKRIKAPTFEDKLKECKEVIDKNLGKVISEIRESDPHYLLIISISEDGGQQAIPIGGCDADELYVFLERIQQRVLSHDQ